MLVETNFETYKKNLIEKLVLNFPEYNITETQKNDNGVILHGIGITKQNENMGPVFYLDEPYKQGESIERFIEYIKDYLENHQQEHIEDTRKIYSDLQSLRTCKDKLYLRVADKRNLDKEIATFSVRETDNLKYYVVYDNDVIDSHNGYIVKITYKILEMSGVSIKELFDIAYENTYNIGYILVDTFTYMTDYLDLGKEKLEELEAIKQQIFIPELMTCKLKGVDKGACASFLFVDDIYKKIGSNFYIIPCSTMETLVIPKIGDDDQYILDMIKNVNDTELDKCDILSYSVFYFDGHRLIEIEPN